MPDFNAKDHKVSEKDILFKTITDIEQKFLKEFRGGYNEKIILGNVVEDRYVPDSRKEAIQAIEFLSYFLLYSYDDVMTEAYRLIEKDKEALLEKHNKGEIDKEDYITTKLKLTIELFQHLMQLCKRKKWMQNKQKTG